MRFDNKMLSRILSFSLSIALVGQAGLAFSATGDGTLSGDVRITVTPSNIHETSLVPGANRTVNMSLHGVSVQDALRALARKGGFNVLIDESVTGEVSVDLNNVTVQDALETLKTSSNLAFSVDGKNLMVAATGSEKAASFSRTTTKIIPLRYANARVTAQLLNSSVFSNPNSAAASASGAATGPVTADFHTNSLVVVGSPTDIKNVMEHIEALDQPREMKTWRLNNSNVLDVASTLAASLFNEGNASFSTGASSSAGGIGTSASSLRAVADNIQEGTGSAQSQAGTSGGSTAGVTTTGGLTLRTRIKSNQTLSIGPNGPLLIPDTRLNTLTLMGTAEQIAMAEAMIPTLDRKLPQVILETSLVELRDIDRKEMGYSTAIQHNNMVVTGNNDPSSTSPSRRLPNANGPNLSNLVNGIFGPGTNTPNFQNMLGIISGRSSGLFANRYAYQLNAMVKQEKAKILANPSMIMTSDTEGVISIVDEIIRSTQVTQGSNGSPPQFQTNIGEAGIVLSMLPSVGADGTITLRIRPTVSTVADQRADANGNLITLLSRREVTTQNVTMHDGETFVLGGLINDTNRKLVARDPILSKLPIVGALARNAGTDKTRTELVIMVTPHIINDESETARTTKVSPMRAANMKTPTSLTDETIIPVSDSGWNQVGGKIMPPLQRPSVIGEDEDFPTNGRIEPTSSLIPQPLQSDELAPATALLAPKPRQGSIEAIKSTDIAPIETLTNVNDTSKAPPAKKPNAPIKDLHNVDSNTIREIMNRYK